MKKFLRVVLTVGFCLLALGAYSYADPGDETSTESTDVVITDPNYPPPPDGYVGEWPPPNPDMFPDGGGPPPPEGDNGDDGSWGDPSE